MCIKQLYNDNLRKLPKEYGDVSVMFVLLMDKMSDQNSTANQRRKFIDMGYVKDLSFQHVKWDFCIL